MECWGVATIGCEAIRIRLGDTEGTKRGPSPDRVADQTREGVDPPPVRQHGQQGVDPSPTRERTYLTRCMVASRLCFNLVASALPMPCLLERI